MTLITLKILNLLVNGDYLTLIDLDSKKELDENYLRDAIEDYGGIMTMPPYDDIEDLLDIYDTNQANIKHIDFDLWFDNEKSDLTLSYLLIENNPKHELNFALKDIHIL